MTTTIISGITGQTASYMTELLLESGHKVYGIIRRAASFNTQRIDHLYNNPNLKLIYGDLSDSSSISQIIGDIKPDFFYNAAAQSHVRVSFDIPEYTVDIDALGTLRILEAIRRFSKHTRFLTCSSSEMFGKTPPPQNENTVFQPRSPYACAKVYSYYQTINYREAYGIFACNSICFNHESPRRGQTFLTRKITKAVGRIYYGLQDKLYLGNLDAKRDWGHAKDYVKAQKMIMEHDTPDDFVVATGKMYSAKEFLEKAFALVNLDPYKYVETDQRLFRPAEVDALCGDPSKIKKTLGWEPEYTFDDLVKEMVDYDMEEARKEAILKNA